MKMTIRGSVLAVAFAAVLIAGALEAYKPARADRTAAGLTCTKSIIYDASTNGATQLVALGPDIALCGYTIWAGGTASVDLRFGTQVTNPCDTGGTKITPAYNLTAQTGVNDTSPLFRGLHVPAGKQLCINTSAGVAVQAVVFFETP